jgi:hypothetical protein
VAQGNLPGGALLFAQYCRIGTQLPGDLVDICPALALTGVEFDKLIGDRADLSIAQFMSDKSLKEGFQVTRCRLILQGSIIQETKIRMQRQPASPKYLTQ